MQVAWKAALVAIALLGLPHSRAAAAAAASAVPAGVPASQCPPGCFPHLLKQPERAALPAAVGFSDCCLDLAASTVLLLRVLLLQLSSGGCCCGGCCRSG